MNTKHLIVGALAVSLLAGASVPVTQAFSFNGFGKSSEKTTSVSDRADRGDRGGRGGCGMFDKMPGRNVELSAEIQSLMTELRTAQKAGDTAKVTALREKVKTQREADQKAQQTAMDTAIAGGYETWKAFVTKQGMPEAMIKNITADNFATFVEFHNTQKKARELEQKLGFPGMGFGEGAGKGGYMRGR